MNTFEHGAIYFSPSTGAHAVHGGIYSKYLSAGGPAYYGLPTFDEREFVNTVSRYQEFKVPGSKFVNAIYWSPAHGAHLIYGEIYGEFVNPAAAVNYQGQGIDFVLGALTSDEENVPGVSGARMNTFENGAIYWSPTAGAHIVAGGFYTAYQQDGGSAGFLGLPTSDETHNANGVVIDFQHGNIQWTAAGGFQTHYYERPGG
jgi:uncharacterized protein with LGFP repeats